MKALIRNMLGGIGVLALCAAQGAMAAVVDGGTAAAHGLDAGLSAFGGNLSLSIGEIPSGVSASSPAPDSTSQSVLEVNQFASFKPGLLSSTFAIELSTGLLHASAESNVYGSAGANESSASASVNDLSFAVGTLNLLNLLSTKLVDLSAVTITSNASVTGAPGSFVTNGGTVLEDASLGVAGVSILGLGLGVGVALEANPAPNLVLVDALGLTVTLNRQLVNGVAGGSCAAFECHISVDAIVLGFTDFVLGTGLLNGELTIGHSEASLSGSVSPVPLPAAFWLFCSGLLALMGVSRRLATRVG